MTPSTTIMTLTLDRTDLIKDRLFIHGQWRAAHHGHTFPVVNPADGQLLVTLADAGPEDARAAVDAAQTAFETWRSVTARERADMLKRLLGLMRTHRQDLGRLISLEQGKPLGESLGEVDYSAAYVEWFAEEARRAYGDVIPEPVKGKRILVIKEPVGVVAAITPWNFPLAMLARKASAAFAAGCSVVAKPAEDTPLSALAFAQLVTEAGAPQGLINVLPASRERTPAVADAWLGDPRVRKVSFTGSTAVGKHLARESAATLKKCSLELGGNAPFIVFEDADLDAAVEGLMVSKFRNAGQTCVCPNRVLVHERVYDAFARKLADRVGALRVGPASQSDAEIGPLINERAVLKVQQHIDDALSLGGTLLVGGRRLGAEGGTFFAPTVIGNATPEMRLAGEETFGPMVPLMRFATESEAVALANDTPFGLAAYFYTNDLARVWRVADHLETGMVAINDGMLSTEVAPFGGVKESGYGREGSRYGLAEFQHMKYLNLGGLDR